MSSMPALKMAVSNVTPTFTSIAESDPQDIIFDMDGTLADVDHRRQLPVRGGAGRVLQATARRVHIGRGSRRAEHAREPEGERRHLRRGVGWAARGAPTRRSPCSTR